MYASTGGSDESARMNLRCSLKLLCASMEVNLHVISKKKTCVVSYFLIKRIIVQQLTSKCNVNYFLNLIFKAAVMNMNCTQYLQLKTR